ncbi:zinc finger MYM-type 2-like [Paramuricea clavata]|uniref:Zinc finger MYM-type 2-like n=1 Tax=Paramuricea clavata TaxID=317549 RepID=A0A7D9E9H0_PARCT|nr:zinc finger MYM-type 2-like [Paramuricea clavata]
MSEFFAAVLSADGSEYEPLSLRSIFASFNRHLKEKDYPEQIIESPCFNKTREALKAKQKELKSLGKGSKPNAAHSLSDEEVDLLYERGEFGTHSARALVNMLWWKNTTHFGLRGCRENRDVRWGDIRLRMDTSGLEFLEYTERQTKTRSGENPRDLRKVKPTMWPCNDRKRDPILAYKRFAEKRPPEACTPDSPFYLGIDHTKHPSIWFTKQPMGKNTINNLLKNMCRNAGIRDEEQKLSNHSARKTMVKKLKENHIPDTDIIQVTGHNNLMSLNTYDELSNDRMRRMSGILSGSDNNKANDSSTPGSGLSGLLSGSAISGGTFNITVNACQSSTLLPTWSSTTNIQAEKRKRVILQSDSDDD